MFQIRPEGYIGDQSDEGYVAYFTEGVLFGVVSFEEGMNPDQGKGLLHSFQEGLQSADISSLASFEEAISKLIIKLNFPVHVGLSIGMLYKDVLYLKTVGDGQVFLRRGNEFSKLLEGDKTASGRLMQLDMAVFTTSHIQKVIGEAQDLRAFVDHSPPKDIIQKLNDEDYGAAERGFGVLLVEFSNTEQPDNALESSHIQTPLPNTPSGERDQAGSRHHALAQITNLIRSKTFAIFAVIVLLGILTWSVIFGYQRRAAARQVEQIQKTQQEIESILTNAEEQAVLDIDQSLAGIKDARSTYQTLAAELGESHADKLAPLAKRIDEAESRILKKETVAYDEFYDLALENENAKATAMGIFENTIAILDANNAVIYVLELDSKALTEYSVPNVASATQVDLYGDDVYYLVPDEGIFRFSSRNKSQKIIDANGDWGKIQDMDVYSGNVYVLDSSNDEVYKYLVTEDGFSDKTSYFGKGESINLADARAMAIDSAIYITTKSALFKFLSGVRDSFSPSLPQDEPAFDDIYTDANRDDVYVLDKSHAAVYIMSKDGEYKKQIQADIFGKALALYAYDGAVHVIYKSTIYEVPL